MTCIISFHFFINKIHSVFTKICVKWSTRDPTRDKVIDFQRIKYFSHPELFKIKISNGRKHLPTGRLEDQYYMIKCSTVAILNRKLPTDGYIGSINKKKTIWKLV